MENNIFKGLVMIFYSSFDKYDIKKKVNNSIMSYYLTLKIKTIFVHLNRYLINWFETIFRQIDTLKISLSIIHFCNG